MTAQMLEGGPIAEKIKEKVRAAVTAMASPPKLAAVLASDNPGAKFYAGSQRKSCAEVGIDYELHDPEKTGALEQMLEKIAEFYDSEVKAMVDGLTSLIEPMLMVVMGVVVGGIIIGLFMPIMNLSQIVGH